MLKRIWENEDGQAMVEYGLIIGLIAVVVIALVVLLGKQIGEVFKDITAALTGAGISGS